VLLTSILIWVAQQYRSDAAWVDHTHEVLATIADVDSSLTRAESSARAFFVNRDRSRISEFGESRDRTFAQARRLRELVSDNAGQQARSDQVMAALKARLGFLERNVGLYDSGTSIDEISKTFGEEGRRLAAAASQEIGQFRHEEEDLLARRVAARRTTNWILLALCGSVMILGIAVAFRGNQMILTYRDSRDEAEERLRVANEQLETRVRERTQELERSNNDLRQFTFAASHDLKEPLRTISIYTDLLRQRYADRLDGNASQVLGFVLKGVARMDALLAGLRTYLEISTTSNAAVPKIDLQTAVNAALEDLNASIEENEAKVECGTLPSVRIHPVHARQLFQNLIGNALKYRSDRTPLISVFGEMNGTKWKIAVRDNGVGVDPQYQRQIFELFKRLYTADEIPGSGLGLAICQTIVRQYGGEIWVDSEAGKGSTFWFTLPAS
jgi:signal transduction histidine kinase